MSSPWTNENIESLKRFAEEKKTGTEIAELLGISRGAVSGKCHRDGIHLISGNPGGKRNTDRIFTRRPADKTYSGDSSPDNKPLQTTATEQLSSGKNPIPVSDFSEMRKITLFELSESTCRWPLGDPKSQDFRYCGAVGADNTQGRPYCPYHSLVAYETPQQRAARRQAWVVRSGRPAVAL